MPDESPESPESRYAAILNNLPFPDEDLDDIYHAHTYATDSAIRQLADGIFPLIKNLNNRLIELEKKVEVLEKDKK